MCSNVRKIEQLGSWYTFGNSKSRFDDHVPKKSLSAGRNVSTAFIDSVHIALLVMPLSARSHSPTSPVSSVSEHAIFLASPRATRHTHLSNDSTESLRNLELTDGPMLASETPKHARQRSFSFSGFDFQADLLPLSSSVSEADTSLRETPGAEKSISLVHGTRISSPFAFWCCWMTTR